MAVDTLQRTNARLRGSYAPTGRGPAPLVRAAELACEGQAFSIDVMKTTARLQTDVASGHRERLVNDLGRLGLRAQEHFHECRRLAGEVEE